MATFIRLANMTAEGVKKVGDFPSLLGEAKAIMEEEGVKILHGYATLGRYDFVVVLEAPDEKAVAKASARIAAKGNFGAETMAAFPIGEFGELMQGA